MPSPRTSAEQPAHSVYSDFSPQPNERGPERDQSTSTPTETWQRVAAQIWSGQEQAPTGLDNFLKGVEQQKEAADRNDPGQLLASMFAGVESKVSLMDKHSEETTPSNTLEQIDQQDRENWSAYKRYLEPGTTRATMGFELIESGKAEAVTAGERLLVEAVTLRPELQFNRQFQQRIRSAYAEMSQKQEGETAPTGAPAADLSAMDRPTGALDERLSLFREKLRLERAYAQTAKTGGDLGALSGQREQISDREWHSYQEYLRPGTDKADSAFTMIASGSPALKAKGVELLNQAVRLRPELEFSKDFNDREKAAFREYNSRKVDRLLMPTNLWHQPRHHSGDAAGSLEGGEAADPHQYRIEGHSPANEATEPDPVRTEADTGRDTGRDRGIDTGSDTGFNTDLENSITTDAQTIPQDNLEPNPDTTASRSDTTADDSILKDAALALALGYAGYRLVKEGGKLLLEKQDSSKERVEATPEKLEEVMEESRRRKAEEIRNLAGQRDRMSETVETLRTDLDRARLERQELERRSSEERTGFETRLGESEKALQAARQELKDAKDASAQEKLELEERVRGLEEKIETDTKTRVDQETARQTEKATLEQSIAELEKRVEDSERARETTRVELESRTRELEAMGGRVNELERDLARNQKDLGEERTRSSRLEADLEQTRTDLRFEREQAAANDSNARKEIEGLKLSLTELEEARRMEAAKAGQNQEQARQEIEGLKRTIADLETARSQDAETARERDTRAGLEINGLKESLEKLEAQRRLESEQSTARDAASSREIETLKADIARLEHESGKSSQEVKTLEESLRALEAARKQEQEATARESQRAREQIDSLKTSIETLETARQQEIERNTASQTESARQIESLKQELQRVETIRQQESERATTRDTESRAQIETLQRALTDAERESLGKDNTIEVLKERITGLEESSRQQSQSTAESEEAARKRIAEPSENVDKLVAEREQASRERASEQARSIEQMEAFKATIAQMRQDHKSESERDAQTIDRQASEIDTLKRSVNDLEAKKAAQERIAETERTRAEALETKVNGLGTRIEELETARRNDARQAEEAQTKSADEIRLLKESITSLKTGHQEEIDKAARDAATRETEIKTLTDRIAELERTASSDQEKAKQATTQIETLKASLAELQTQSAEEIAKPRNPPLAPPSRSEPSKHKSPTSRKPGS
ncbi:MAG: hypothetical protein IPM23_18610 [Candidatus Melainabacteria bacterium]|nr:hypothetical protein [Candidatus Melainabacteria bacterium]